MNKPVTLEIAKLLEERKFNGNTHYDDNWKELVWYHVKEGNLHPWSFFESFDNMIKAPTISEAVMWIYEKYGIWIGCTQLKGKQVFDCDIEGKIITIAFNSPTEAYLKAIEYTLKELI